MNNLSDGLMYEVGCHSLADFIVTVLDLTHHDVTNWLNEWLTV